MAELHRLAAGERFPLHPASPRLVPYRLLPVAAGFVLAVGAAVWLARSAPPAPVPEVTRPAGFVTLPLADALPAIESGSIVRITLATAALPSYGIPIVPEIRTEFVAAEVLVAQDGQPRAIRLVRNASTTGSTP